MMRGETEGKKRAAALTRKRRRPFFSVIAGKGDCQALKSAVILRKFTEFRIFLRKMDGNA